MKNDEEEYEEEEMQRGKRFLQGTMNGTMNAAIQNFKSEISDACAGPTDQADR